MQRQWLVMIQTRMTDCKLVAKETSEGESLQRKKLLLAKSWSPLLPPSHQLPWENKTDVCSSMDIGSISRDDGPRKHVCCYNFWHLSWLCTEFGYRCHRLNNLACLESLHMCRWPNLENCPNSWNCPVMSETNWNWMHVGAIIESSRSNISQNLALLADVNHS